MAKKKSNNKLMTQLGIGTAILVFLGLSYNFLKGMGDFLDVPEAVAENTKKIDKIDKYIERQQITNDILTEHFKSKKEKPILSPNGKKFFDKETGTWRPIRELR